MRQQTIVASQLCGRFMHFLEIMSDKHIYGRPAWSPYNVTQYLSRMIQQRAKGKFR